MIKLAANTLNIHDGVHAVARFTVDSLVRICPDLFKESSVEDCDAVMCNAPAAPPYSFNYDLAQKIVGWKKPIFVINDADGAPPDCENCLPTPEKSFGEFVRGGNGIKAYFYREYFKGYERPDLKFPLLPFELVGFVCSNHPKDKLATGVADSLDAFMRRGIDIHFASSCHARSRVIMFDALKDYPRAKATNLYKHCPLVTDYLRELNNSKISIALEGGGIKCRSHCEVPFFCAMAMPSIEVHESYPWIHGVNCIRLPYDRNCGEGSLVHNEGRGLVNIGASFQLLRHYLDNPDKLYQVYVNGMLNAEHYRIENYFRHWVGANIVKYL